MAAIPFWKVTLKICVYQSHQVRSCCWFFSTAPPRSTIRVTSSYFLWTSLSSVAFHLTSAHLAPDQEGGCDESTGERTQLCDSKKQNDGEVLYKTLKAINGLQAEKKVNAAIQNDLLKLKALAKADEEDDRHLWRLQKQRGDRRGYKIQNDQAILVADHVYFPNGTVASAFDSNHKMRGKIPSYKEWIEAKRYKWEALIVYAPACAHIHTRARTRTHSHTYTHTLVSLGSRPLATPVSVSE